MNTRETSSMNRRDWVRLLAAATVPTSSAWGIAGSKGLFRSAICAYSFRGQLQAKSMTYADLIRLASDLGVEGVDLTTYWLPDTSDQTLLPLKRLAYRSAVSIYSLGIRATMAQPTPGLQAAQVEAVQQWLGVAEKLGAAHMRIFGGDVPKGANQEQAVAWAVATLKRCSDEAAKKGITLGIEDDGGITTNADRTVEIVRNADSPWVGINLDVGNFPNNAYAQIEMCAPYATNVHLKTLVHIDDKKEPADWPRILRILGNAGYCGYLALEYEFPEQAPTAVPKLIARMQDAIRSARSG